MLEFAQFPNTKARAHHWAETTATRSLEGDEFFFVIEELASATEVGMIDTHRCDPRVGSFSYGIGVMAEHRHKGYASEAVLLVARYYFQELRYQKLNVQVHDDNAASIALHERLGFTQEGRLRRNVYKAGQFHDLLCYGMTAEEFLAQHAEWAF
jgi:RimJ/RimL family protein N-acetyltransferase